MISILKPSYHQEGEIFNLPWMDIFYSRSVSFNMDHFLANNFFNIVVYLVRLWAKEYMFIAY